jgi:hypothetical protein
LDRLLQAAQALGILVYHVQLGVDDALLDGCGQHAPRHSRDVTQTFFDSFGNSSTGTIWAAANYQKPLVFDRLRYDLQTNFDRAILP